MNLDNIINRYQLLMENYIITHGDNKDFIFNDFENMVRHIYGGSEGTETTPQQRQNSIFSISIFDLIKEIDKKLSQPILFLLDSKLYAHVTMLDFTMSNKDIKPQTVLRKQIFNESYKSQDDSILNELLNKNKFSSAEVKWMVPSDTGLHIIAQTAANFRMNVPSGRVAQIPLQLYYGPSDYNILKI